MPIYVPEVTKAEKKLRNIFAQTLAESAEEILARPGVVTPFGLRNLTADEARIVAQYRAMQEAEAGPKPQAKVRTPIETTLETLQRAPLGAVSYPFSPSVRETYREARGRGETPFGAIVTAEREGLADTPSVRFPVTPKITIPFGQRPTVQPHVQLGLKGAAELALDPTNLLPGIGFGGAIGKVGQATLKTGARKTAQGLVKIPVPPVQEAGLRLVGAGGGVAGGAPIPLRPSDVPARITKFLKPDVQAQWDEVVKQADLLNIKTEAVAGILPDEYFLAAQSTKETPKKIRQAFSQSNLPVIPGGAALPSHRTLFFADFEALGQFLKTSDYKPPSLRFGGRPIENIEPEYVAKQFAPEPKPLGARAELRRSARSPQMGESLRPAQVSEERRVAALEKLGQQQGIEITIHPETPPPPPKPVAPAAVAQERLVVRKVPHPAGFDKPYYQVFRERDGKMMAGAESRQAALTEGRKAVALFREHPEWDVPDAIRSKAKPPTPAERRRARVPKPAPKAVAPASADEPWKMTQEEYNQWFEKRMARGGIEATKPVPAEVLADYPDLAAGGVVRKEAVEDIAAAPPPAARAGGTGGLTGPEIIRALGFAMKNAAEAKRYIQEDLVPTLERLFGESPKDVRIYLPGRGLDPQLRIPSYVNQALWRRRLESLGFVFDSRRGRFADTQADYYRLPDIAAEEAAPVPVRTPRVRRTPPPQVGAPGAAPVEAAGVAPPSPAAAPSVEGARAQREAQQLLDATETGRGGAGKPPGEPPTAQAGDIPPADPLEARPRTLLDMNREAKGMRAMTPEQRAAIMDLAKPIEGDIIYQARPFNEHAENLLGPDTQFMKALRGLPGLRQVYGVWNPAQMARDNPVAMIGLRQSIFQEIEKQRIRFVTLRWWHEADNAFGFKQFETAYGLKPTTGIWRATKVKAASPGLAKGKMFGTFNDMVEHPERYVFDDAQTKVLYLADNTLTQSVRDAQRAGVNVVEIAEEYWPRIVTKGPKGEKGFAGVRKRVSAAKGYTHQRAFADIDDLVKAGYTVETDPRRVFASRLEAGIDTIAQANSRKQIAALPGVEKPLERMERRFPQVLQTASAARVARDAAKQTVVKAKGKATPAEVMALRQAEANYITAMRDVFAKKVEAGEPGYYELRLPNGRIAPQELVDQVGKLIDLPELRQAGEGAAARLTQEVSQLLRTTLTNVDLAAGFIQGQTLVYRNNVAWWTAQSAALVGLIDDPTAYIARYFSVIDEGVRAGAIVAPTEFLFAKQGIASIPLRIPYIGPSLGAFNRAFEWFITAGQLELYRAARSGVAKNAGMDELVSLGSAIRKEVGTESYAILGVRPNQRTFEALSLFAARFFRASVGILGQSFTRGPGGAEARKAVGSLIAGGLALTMGIKWAQDKKLPNMTDPYAPDWMQWRWGKTYYNAFGPFYPYFRTMARMGVAFAEGDPWKARRALTSFLQSKESLPLRAIDIAGQLIYFGSANVYGTKIERTWTSIARGILSEFVTPISAQEIPAGLAGGRPETVLEFGGLVGRPVRLASEWAKDLQPYNAIPTNTDDLKKGELSRTQYRKTHPDVDAKLFITGAVSSLQTLQAVKLAVQLIREGGIDPNDITGVKARKERRQKVAGLDPTLVDDLIAALEGGTRQPVRKLRPIRKERVKERERVPVEAR